MTTLEYIPPPPPSLPPIQTTYHRMDDGWEIIQAKRLKPGDVIAPMNHCGPLARVLSVHHGTKDFVVEVIDGIREIDLPFKAGGVDRIQPLSGWVPRRTSTDGYDTAA